MRHALKLAVLPLCLAALHGTSAKAADDAELERIRNAIATAIEPSKDPGMPHVELAQPVGAAWRDGRAVISLKGAKLVKPEDATLAVGDVVIAVLPRGDGFYDFDVTMPNSVDLIGVDGKPEGKLSVARYKIAGTWSHDVESLTNLDAAFNDIEVKDLSAQHDKVDAKVGTIEARMNYTKGSSGLWSGTANGRIADLRILAEGGSEDVSIATIDAKGSTTGSDWAAWQSAMDKFEKAIAPGAPPLGPEERRALSQAIHSINWGVNEGSFSIKGLKVASGGQRLFTLGNTTWKLALDGSKEAGPLSLRFAINDLSVEENTLPTNLAPTKGALDITLDQFPLRAFFGSMLEQALESGGMTPAKAPPDAAAPTDEAMAEPSPDAAGEPGAGGVAQGDPATGAAGDAMAPDEGAEPPPSETQEPPKVGPFAADDWFLQQLFALGTVFVLNEFSVDAPGTGVSASGRLRVDPEAMGMGTGKLKASLRGIDAVLAYANAEAKTNPDMKDISSFLIYMKGLGKAESGSGGETVYVYDIDVPKDGPPTVNGTAIDGMMGE